MPLLHDLDGIVRDLCSVEFRSKSETRRIIVSAYTRFLEEEIKFTSELQDNFPILESDYYDEASKHMKMRVLSHLRSELDNLKQL